MDFRAKAVKWMLVSAVTVTGVDITSTTYVEAKRAASEAVTARLQNGFKVVASRMGYAPKVAPMPEKTAKQKVVHAAVKYGVNPDLALAVWQVESRGNQFAESSAGAIGHMQIMPINAVKLCGYKHSAELYDEDKNIDCGVRYVAELMRQYRWDVTKALRNYNAGTACAKAEECKAGDDYVRLVMAALAKNVNGEV